MAINPFIESEIKRKAEAGIPLDVSTPEKDALYKQYQDNILRHIKSKAEAGTPLDTPNDWKSRQYQQFQDRSKQLIQQKANTGQPLDYPNAWKQEQYDAMRQAAIPQYQSPSLPSVPSASEIAKGLQDQSADWVNKIYEQQKASQLAQMKASRDKAVGEINQQKANTAPAYQQARNQADVVNAQNVKRLREMMAANGLTSSGENVSAQVAQNNQRQANLNALNLQEQQTIDDYNRRITDLMNPANEQALIAALEAERSKALYDAYMNAQTFGYQQYRDAISDNRYTDETAYSRFMDTLNQRNYLDERNYQRQYQEARDKVADQQYAAEKAWREYTYNNMSAAEKAQLDWAKQQYGEDAAWRMYALEYEGELNKAMNQAQINAYGDPLAFIP